jgi:hypothetical protein
MPRLRSILHPMWVAIVSIGCLGADAATSPFAPAPPSELPLPPEQAVAPAQAASTDQQMLLALQQAQSKQPPLQVVEGPLFDAEDA